MMVLLEIVVLFYDLIFIKTEGTGEGESKLERNGMEWVGSLCFYRVFCE
jgi:hypothetical protein